MFEVTKKSMQWGEETLTLETGKVARQADGTVIATLGETSVMAEDEADSLSEDELEDEVLAHDVDFFDEEEA